MSKIVVWATDKDGEGDVLKVGVYESVYNIRIPVGHFAPDVVLTFEEDMDEVNEAHRKRKGWDKIEQES
jgi:hypothetical protein